MFTLRCAKRALDRSRSVPDAGEAQEPETLVGDWHANLLNVGREWQAQRNESNLKVGVFA